ncbi:MAG TPA: metallophosphoesterase [Phycisphaerae bacterium]|nr:metallophosphoesterase [Phycisphaerae bacterium]
MNRAFAIAAFVCVLLAPCLGRAAPADQAAPNPAVEITQYVEKVLAARDAGGRDEWSFAVAADTHVQYYDQTYSEPFAALLTSWIRSKVDFGVIVGDLGGPGHHEPFGRQLAATANCPPVLVAVGNHEMDREGKKAWLNAVYPGVVTGEGKLNDRAIYYSVNYRQCHFVFLDGDRIIGRQWLGDQLSPDQLVWLEKDLQANRGRTTFLFVHHPVESTQQGKGEHVLAGRAALVAMRKRFPDVRWIFQGHLHYDEAVRIWGLHSVHVFRQPLAVRVRGKAAELCRIAPTGLVPLRDDEWNDLGRKMDTRWDRDQGRDVLRIAETTLERFDGHARLGRGVDGDVRPTRGPTMLKVSSPLPAGVLRPPLPFQPLVSNTEFIPVVQGMTFAYDVRFERSSHDEMALHLNVTFPDGRKAPVIVDADGVPMQAVQTGRWTYAAPSLKGKAAGRWYSRSFDLTPWAGGWIDRILLVTRAPKPAGETPADLNLYVDNIRFILPPGTRRPSSN